MLRKPVNSSRIKSVGWSNNVLEVEFHNGAIYHYFGVSEFEYTAFMHEPSLGSALSRLDKQHTYKRIN